MLDPTGHDQVRNEIRDLEIRAWNTRDIQDSPVEEGPEVSEGLSVTERAMFKKELEEREELQSLLRIINYALDESLHENLDIWSNLTLSCRRSTSMSAPVVTRVARSDGC